MWGIIRRLMSYRGPVLVTRPGHVTLWIRGTVFEGASVADVREQVRMEAEGARAQLREQASSTAMMMLSSNPSGRANVGGTMMGDTQARLEAYESFLREG